MGKFQIEQCGQIEGLYLIQPTVFGDNRGYFMETYNYNEFKELGLDMVFVQDNQSKSTKGVLRGMHYQKEHTQGKLVRVISGKVYDVVVDIRKDSKNIWSVVWRYSFCRGKKYDVCTGRICTWFLCFIGHSRVFV